MKAWVIGKDGLVGQDLCRYLTAQEIDYVGSSHKEADILDPKALANYFDRHRPTHIFNCAAVVEVDACENEKKQLAYDINVTGVENIAILAAKKGIRVIHISTDFVFDGKKADGYRETDPTNPINVYGETKLEGERRLSDLCERAVIVRTSWLYGSTKPGHVSMVLDRLKTNKEIEMVTDLQSSPTNTEDLAKALFEVRNLNGVYHFANRGSATRFEFAEEVKKLAGQMGIPLQCKVIRAVTQADRNALAKRPPSSILLTEKIAPKLTFRIRTWQEALADHMNRHSKLTTKRLS